MTKKKPKSVLGRNPKLIRIYILMDPRDMYIHYVGYTDSLTRRLSQHCSVFNISTTNEAWLHGLQKLGMRPRMKEVAKVFPTQDPRAEEATWIRYFISKGFVLFNAYTPGLPIELKRVFTVDEMVTLSEGGRIHLSKENN